MRADAQRIFKKTPLEKQVMMFRRLFLEIQKMYVKNS